MNRKLQWDPVKEQFVGDDEANQLVDMPRRKGYELPEYPSPANQGGNRRLRIGQYRADFDARGVSQERRLCRRCLQCSPRRKVPATLTCRASRKHQPGTEIEPFTFQGDKDILLHGCFGSTNSGSHEMCCNSFLKP